MQGHFNPCTDQQTRTKYILHVEWNFVKSDGGSTKGRPVNHTLNADSERDDIVILKFAYSR